MLYKKKGGWYIGHIQQYPEYESQGSTLDELKKNLIEIYNDINSGLVPDAEPFHLMEVAAWKEKNWLGSSEKKAVYLCGMAAITIGTEILSPVSASPSQDIPR